MSFEFGVKIEYLELEKAMASYFELMHSELF